MTGAQWHKLRNFVQKSCPILRSKLTKNAGLIYMFVYIYFLNYQVMLRKLTSQNEFKISIWLYNVEGFIKLFKCRFIIGTLKTLYIAPLIIFDLYLMDLVSKE